MLYCVFVITELLNCYFVFGGLTSVFSIFRTCTVSRACQRFCVCPYNGLLQFRLNSEGTLLLQKQTYEVAHSLLNVHVQRHVQKKTL